MLSIYNRQHLFFSFLKEIMNVEASWLRFEKTFYDCITMRVFFYRATPYHDTWPCFRSLNFTFLIPFALRWNNESRLAKNNGNKENKQKAVTCFNCTKMIHELFWAACKILLRLWIFSIHFLFYKIRTTCMSIHDIFNIF